MHVVCIVINVSTMTHSNSIQFNTNVFVCHNTLAHNYKLWLIQDRTLVTSVSLVAEMNTTHSAARVPALNLQFRLFMKETDQNLTLPTRLEKRRKICISQVGLGPSMEGTSINFYVTDLPRPGTELPISRMRGTRSTD